MQIRFADTRPQGDYALVVPVVAGKDRSTLATLGGARQSVETALDRQRFEGEESSVSETVHRRRGRRPALARGRRWRR